MTYNLKAAIEQGAARALDPDYALHPHLFTNPIISNEEISQHQARHQARSKAATANRLSVTLDEPDSTVAEYSIPADWRAYSGVIKVVPRDYLAAAGWTKPKGRIRA